MQRISQFVGHVGQQITPQPFRLFQLGRHLIKSQGHVFDLPAALHRYAV